MNNQKKFIGICFDSDFAGKTYIEWLPIYEQKVEQETYQQDNAVQYLNDIIKLSTLYSRLNLWHKMEKLAEKVEGIAGKVEEYEDEASYVVTFLKVKIFREYRQLSPLKESLKEITNYAIKSDNKFVMHYTLNGWGNFFSRLGHTDLAMLFYMYCLDFAHSNYQLFKQTLYPEFASYPLSNILSYIADDDERMDMWEKLYQDETVDSFTRLYFGGRLKDDCNSLHREFDESLLQSLSRELFGIIDRTSIDDCLFDFYFKEDYAGMDKYYEEHYSDFTPYTHILYYAISNCENKGTKVKKWVNPDSFREWVNVLSTYMDDLERVDQDSFFLQFLEYVRNAQFIINYDDCRGFIDYLKSTDSMFSIKQVGRLMLDHAGDNEIYQFADELILEMMPYCHFRADKSWLSDAVERTNVGNAVLRNEIVDNCIKVLDEHCCFEKKFPVVESNIEICRDLLKGTDFSSYSSLETLLIEKKNEYKKGPIWGIFARAGYISDIPKLESLKDIEESSEDIDLIGDKSNEEEFQYKDIPLIKDNPYYQDLKQKMEDNTWEIDEKDININLIHAYCGDDHCLLYLFYNPDPAWLGDEERFNDEEPLWFSESSHLVSPVWRIRSYMNSRQIGDDDLTQFPIVVMLPPTYVINGEDMEDSWNTGLKVIVVKFREIMRSLSTSGTLPKETNFKEISDRKYYYEGDKTIQFLIKKNITDNYQRPKAQQTVDGGGKKKAIATLNDPWNLRQVYDAWKSTPYHRDHMGDNTSDPGTGKMYELTGLGLLQVVNAFLSTLADNPDTQELANHINEATIGLYFKMTSVKFRLTADWNPVTRETLLREFIIDSFNDDRMDFIKGVDRNSGQLCGSDLYFRGNLVSPVFETLIRIKNSSDGYTYIRYGNAEREEDKNQKLATVGKLFNDQLQQEVWEQGVSGVSAPILADVVKRLAEKTAKTAIMSRNMSHNLGSHVMAYLKRDLASVGDIMSKGVLHDFYPLPDDFANGNDDEDNNNIGTLVKLIERYTKDVEMPFLVGLGKFISYLQERQDFIATIATDYIPYFSAVNFKDDIYDTINPDYRYFRHSDRRGNRPENILMKYIALSEGLSRDITQQGKRKHDIVVRFRKFDGINDFLFQKQRNMTKPNGPGRFDLEDMRQYSFYLPGGIVGRQAFFTILENLIRNSAKHGHWRQKNNLEFTFDIHKGREFATNSHSEELYGFLKNEPKWSEILSSEENKLDKFYILTLTDNLVIEDSDFDSLKNAIVDRYVNEESGKMINKHKGIKEIRISAGWMRGISDDLNPPSDEPPVVTVRKVGESLQYIFCVLAPKKVLLISDDKEERNSLRQAVKDWEGWYVSNTDDYKRTRDKSYDIIALHYDSEVESLRPISADRLVVAYNIFKTIAAGQANMETCENALYKELYDISDFDEPILIADGKTKMPISSNIHLVSADAEALAHNVVYKYCYRTHHQDPQEFSDYMESKLKEEMISVEGITGNNSTDRLIRNEKLDDIWYYKHLHALRTKVAIFDERLFSKVTGLEDKELIGDEENVLGNREALVCAQKRVWYFNIIYKDDENKFEVFGLLGECKNGEGDYQSIISKVADIIPASIEVEGLGVIPSISININYSTYTNFADYISVHQGIMDKFYDALKIKQPESYSVDVQQDPTKLDTAKKTAMRSVSVKFFEAFHTRELFDEFEELLSQFGYNGAEYYERHFCPGFFIHSGRSKPSEFDMPQKQPFIQYAAIENAAYDCKYSLVELLKSARYEPND